MPSFPSRRPVPPAGRRRPSAPARRAALRSALMVGLAVTLGLSSCAPEAGEGVLPPVGEGSVDTPVSAQPATPVPAVPGDGLGGDGDNDGDGDGLGGAQIVDDECAELERRPYPDRLDHLDGLDGDARTRLDRRCPETVAAVGSVAAVVERSAPLADSIELLRGARRQRCDTHRLLVPYHNTYDAPVRLIAAGVLESLEGHIVTSTWGVSDRVDPGGTVTVHEAFVGGDEVGRLWRCIVHLHVFLELDEEATDTWTGLPPAPVATDGDGMAAVIADLLAVEVEVRRTGDWRTAGVFEDVRSANYLGLVNHQGPVDPFQPDEIVRICATDDVAPDLRAVVWETVRRGQRKVIARTPPVLSSACSTARRSTVGGDGSTPSSSWASHPTAGDQATSGARSSPVNSAIAPVWPPPLGRTPTAVVWARVARHPATGGRRTPARWP